MSLFNRLYDILVAPSERLGFGNRRQALLAGAHGRVLEVGCGTGLNFPHYPAGRVSALVALDPSAEMLSKARRRAAPAPVPVELVQGSAEQLPFPDSSFDAVVGTLVLCSVNSQAASLREMRRVLKPEGDLLLLEHVRSHRGWLAALQHLVTPATKRVLDGCHWDRDTVGAVRAAGFAIDSLEPDEGAIFVTVRATRPAGVA